LSISEFSGYFFDFLPPSLLLVVDHRAMVIVGRLVQGRGNVYDGDGSKPGSRDRNHTVAIKTAL